MSHPDKKPHVKSHPDGDPESLYRVHASMTTDLASVRALNETEALGAWLGGENVRGELICGRVRTEPFRHLEARIDAGKPEEQIVHIISKDVLTSSWGDVPC